ncbi:hypothetical protein Acr_12g0004050 [Actinidia rufa]|uniref:Uncharacterized protein n=1 Tax=Actinidia rufa TaxID=165716 RepID=A0A7J0FGN6_9ERIC|nr:hypothetical protein Acr_12g0004050 [Actinidia rufa]
MKFLETLAAPWPLVDEINGAGVAGGGGSKAGATGGGGEAAGDGDVTCGEGLEGGRGDKLSF